jgi:2-methylcitrate dehydratase PrpD
MLLHDIADYAVGERTARLPVEAVHHAKRAVIDWFAALFPGSVVAPATLYEQALAEDLDRGEARLAGGRRATLRAAAMINGSASHTVEFDDIFKDAIYHPGCPVISAALAAAQTHGVSGDAFLRAVIVGYEVSTRIGVAMGRDHYKYWHTTGTIGTFGAAAAVATVLGCDRERFAHALATCATWAAALQQAFRSESMSKPLHAGHAADAGALAAMGAAKGVTGALDVLDGTVGFGVAMSGSANWAEATAGLGTRYNITSMTFKNHACCGHTFAAADAAIALRNQHRLAPSQIARVRVFAYQATLDVTGSYKADTPFEAKFSLPYVVACALVHGSVRLGAFTPERLADPVVKALMPKVTFERDAAIDAAFPKQRSARVEIDTTDGRHLVLFQPARVGDPELPFTDEQVVDKYLELAAPVIGAERAKPLLDRLWTLDRLADVRSLHGGPR